MTEAVRQSQSLASVSTQVHSQWREDTDASALIAPPPSSRMRHGSLGVTVPSLYVPSAKGADSARLLKEQNVTVPTLRTIEKHTDYEIMNENKPKEQMDAAYGVVDSLGSLNDGNVFYSGSEASVASKTTTAEIKWRKLADSEEETSEEYDDGEDSEEGDDDKAGVSDTETRNLLEDGAEDEDDEPDSDGANTINAAHSNASSQIAQMQAESESKGKGDGPTGMDDDSLFEMSEQQKDYYCKCFVYLIKLTQGLVDLKGAVHGADEKVVDFFKKSNLGTDTLSRIWALSDVNEDGFLDLAEFSTAMHLIVLNIKGQIAIPERLPDSIRPPLTPPRNVNALSDGKWRVQSSSGMSNSAQHNWRQFDFDESRGRISPLQTHHQQQYHSLSDDHLHLHIAKSETPEHLSDFSDVPPLLVDGRPTALKATQPVICSTQVPACPSLKAPFSSEALRLTLSPPAPKGPPPKPPPRPANKGHGRSASLDLNTLASAVTLGPSAGIYAGIATAQRSGTLPAHASLRFHPSPPTISESPGAAPLPALPQAAGVLTPPVSARPPFAAPIPPRRSTPVDAQTQTENACSRQHVATCLTQPELIQFNLDVEKRIEELLADENLAMSGAVGTHVNWKERCAQLKKLNAELELERTKLAQIRLQLELRLNDPASTPSSIKPTAL